MEEDFLPQGVGGVDLALGPYFKGNGSLGKFDGLLEEGKGANALEFEGGTQEALQEQFVIEALGVEAEGKRTERPGVPLREIKNGDWQFVVEEVTILRQQGEIDDEAFHSANVD